MAVATWAATSKDEQTLEREISAINQTASRPEGEKMVVQRLEKEFKVDRSMIGRLRGQRIGYGEIATMLSIAQKMPGGVTDANMNRIMSFSRSKN